MFGWLENATNHVLGWFGIDARSPGEKEATRLSRDNYNLQYEDFQHRRFWDQKNFEFMQENQAYERNLQQVMFNREDTSVQRRTADLKAAGINPILAAGQGASAGPVVQSHAPQHHNTATTPDASGVINAEMKRLAAAQMVMQALKMRADIAHTDADTARIRQQAEHDKVRLGYEGEYLNLDHNRYNIELERLGLSRDSLNNDVKHTIIKQEELDLRRTEFALRERQFEVERVLSDARKGLIDTQTASEKLRQQGIQYEVAQKALEHDITYRDLLISVEAGMRYKDSTSPVERTAHRTAATLTDIVQRITQRRR